VPIAINLTTDELYTNFPALIVEHERQTQRRTGKCQLAPFIRLVAPPTRAPQNRRLKGLPEEFAFSTTL
jgi:hypothetical protein